MMREKANNYAEIQTMFEKNLAASSNFLIFQLSNPEDKSLYIPFSSTSKTKLIYSSSLLKGTKS